MNSMKKVIKTKKRRVHTDRTGLFVPACLFLGMGIGFLTNQLVAGLFIGLGSGFLLMAISKTWMK